jgi:hypothetical protein
MRLSYWHLALLNETHGGADYSGPAGFYRFMAGITIMPKVCAIFAESCAEGIKNHSKNT